MGPSGAPFRSRNAIKNRTYFTSAGDWAISQWTSCGDFPPIASSWPMWQVRGNLGLLGTWRVHSPTARSSGASLILTRPLGLLKPLSAYQAIVESSYRTTHSSLQPLQKNPPENNKNILIQFSLLKGSNVKKIFYNLIMQCTLLLFVRTYVVGPNIIDDRRWRWIAWGIGVMRLLQSL